MSVSLTRLTTRWSAVGTRRHDRDPAISAARALYHRRPMASLPLIDLHATPDVVAHGIGDACRAHGFFYIVGHGIDESLGRRLEDLSHRFFALPEATKARYAMPLAGRAWRGWFPLGGELTSGRPDWKEGLYLGTELSDEHPLVRAGTPVHGRNLFPNLPGFRSTVLAYLDAVSALAHRLMEG